MHITRIKHNLVWYIFTGIISSMGVFCHIPYSSVEKLYDSLLSSYNTQIRPLQDQNSTLVLRVRLTPSVLICLHTTNQMMSIFGQFNLQWHDDFLQWNTTEYDGVKTVKLNVKDIWHPVLLLSTAYHNREAVGFPDDKVTVASGGLVQWSAEGVYSIVCEIDITFYPFDTQECRLYLFVADETSKEVLLQPMGDGLHTGFSSENAEWKYLDSRIEIHNYVDHELDLQVQLLRYRFLFCRRPSFIMYTTVGPMVLLAFLNSFVFLVPISSGEKGSIAITVLLSFSVTISSVSSALPSNSLHSPLLFILMTILEIHSAVAVFVVMFQSRLYQMTNGVACFQQLFGSRYPAYEINDEEGNINDRAVYQKNHNSTSNNDRKHLIKKSDLALFSISLALNIVTMSVFAYRLYKGMRHVL